MRIKSPGYPNINLNETITLAGKLFTSSRQNVVDREAAAKDLGFSGLTGHSMKMLSNLTHFGLVEKAGKGGLRLTDLAVKLLHPRNDAEKKKALQEAAYSPGLFAAIKEQWPDGFVSENALRSYLMRNGFSSVAVAPAVSSYMETYSILQQEGATESHGQATLSGENGGGETGDDQRGERQEQSPTVPRPERPASVVAPASQPISGVTLMSGERELTTGLLSKGAGFRLIVHGKIGEKEIDRLIRKLQLDKEILAEADDDETHGPEDHGS